MSDQETRIRQLEERIRQLTAEVADLRADNEALRRLSRRDGLTDLLNRRGGLEEWGWLCQEAMRRGEAVSIVFLDLVGFKAINDRCGQPAGDRVLQAVAEALRGSTRGADILCRPGGDEFVVMLPRTNAEGTTRMVARIERGLAALRVSMNGHDLEGVVARYATETNLNPTADPPHGMWDNVGTKIKADKSHGD